MGKRGQLTEEVRRNTAEVLPALVLTQAELRFLPYVHYCAINRQYLEPHRVSQEERVAWSLWREKGWVSGGATEPVRVLCPKFYRAMNTALWGAYFNFDAVPEENDDE